MKKKLKIIFVVIIAVSSFTGLIIFSLFFLPFFNPGDNVTGRSSPLSEVYNITLIVEYVSQPMDSWENVSLFGYQTSVLDALEEKCDVQLSFFSNGALVIGINGVAGDWVYYVNGLFAGVGAADYYLSHGDSIHWKHVNI